MRRAFVGVPGLFRSAIPHHQSLTRAHHVRKPCFLMRTPPSARPLTTSSLQAAAARDALLQRKGYRPGDKVVIFDGVCAMCNSGVDLVMRSDTQREFKFAALQSETGKALAEKYGAPTDLSTMVYVEDEKAYVKSEAMLRIGRRLGWYMALPAELALMALPKRLRDFLYTDVIAKNRYQVFGKRDVCRFVEPGEEHRFLD